MSSMQNRKNIHTWRRPTIIFKYLNRWENRSASPISKLHVYIQHNLTSETPIVLKALKDTMTAVSSSVVHAVPAGCSRYNADKENVTLAGVQGSCFISFLLRMSWRNDEPTSGGLGLDNLWEKHQCLPVMSVSRWSARMSHHPRAN